MCVHLYCIFSLCNTNGGFLWKCVCVYVCTYVYMHVCVETECVHMNFYFLILNIRDCV